MALDDHQLVKCTSDSVVIVTRCSALFHLVIVVFQILTLFRGEAFGSLSRQFFFLQAQFDMKRIKKNYFALNQWPKISSLPAPTTHKQV